MHYIGNASIANYSCEYRLANVVGAAVIAVVATNVALSIFFQWRASWTDSWWKRMLSGALLAGAVSGMHWCASTGTSYRLLRLHRGNRFSRNTVILVLVILSVTAALTVAGVIIRGTWVARGNARKTRHVTLAAAIFDRTGRILVRPDGLLPSEKITDMYVEKTASDTFSIENPLFQWMFQASRNWSSINGAMDYMDAHIAHLSHDGRGRDVRLVSENGQLIEHYEVISRELFCLAANRLATRLKERLIDVGILWDDILPTGKARQYQSREDQGDSCEKGEATGTRGSQSGCGSLIVLVRRLEHSHDAERLEAAGFRFADVRHVSGIIGSRMQIETADLRQTLTDMAAYAESNTMIDPMVHLGFFGIRARVDGHGFDVLVEKGARNLLPAAKLPLERLEPWHTDFLRRYEGAKMPLLQQRLSEVSSRHSPLEAHFASLLIDALGTLRGRVDNQLLEEATLSCQTVQVPCRSRPELPGAGECTMMVLHLMIPIHYSLDGSGCDFIPLSFFKVHQMAYEDSPFHTAFTQQLYRELVPTIQELPAITQIPSHQRVPWGRRRSSHTSTRRFTPYLRDWRSSTRHPVDVGVEGSPAFAMRRLVSRGISEKRSVITLHPWRPGRSDTKSPKSAMGTKRGVWPMSRLGGILVSQDIKVAISRAEEGRSQSPQGCRESRSQSPPPSRRAPAPSPTRCGYTGAESSSHRSALELHPKANSEQHLGQILVSTVVASGNGQEMMTFVDELFSTCVRQR
ncbi:hypothetical protein F5Y14DRAFT_236355 [Nemania sp. NC0429]|nr:hypothetical protein F5Y14DRAFT_236355 [Nemania sp. NC0429]